MLSHSIYYIRESERVGENAAGAQLLGGKYIIQGEGATGVYKAGKLKSPFSRAIMQSFFGEYHLAACM